MSREVYSVQGMLQTGEWASLHSVSIFANVYSEMPNGPHRIRFEQVESLLKLDSLTERKGEKPQQQLAAFLLISDHELIFIESESHNKSPPLSLLTKANPRTTERGVDFLPLLGVDWASFSWTALPWNLNKAKRFLIWFRQQSHPHVPFGSRHFLHTNPRLHQITFLHVLSLIQWLGESCPLSHSWRGIAE